MKTLAIWAVAVLGLVLAGAAAKEAPKDPPMFEAGPDGKVEIFNGKDLTGWEADSNYWRVEDGVIVGQTNEAKHPYSYLTTTKSVGDFRLTLMVKLVPNAENSGIQVRSVRVGKDEMKGPQCDVGKGWWGRIYDEHGKGLLVKTGFDQHVKADDWNLYEIVAVGPRIRIAVNGQPCADVTDKDLRQTGVIGLQVHSGGPIDVRFKDLKLELNPKEAELLTVKK